MIELPPDKFPVVLKDNMIAYCYVGSRVICDPVPKKADQDILILLERKIYKNLGEKFQNWMLGGSQPTEMSIFSTYKKKIDGIEFNLICTPDPSWFKKFIRATELCRDFNVVDKNDRIYIFDKVMGVNQDQYSHLPVIKGDKIDVLDDINEIDMDYVYSKPMGLEERVQLKGR